MKNIENVTSESLDQILSVLFGVTLIEACDLSHKNVKSRGSNSWK